MRCALWYSVVVEPGQYKQRAKEAEERAKKARDPAVKASWQQVANDWHEMAKQAERNGK